MDHLPEDDGTEIADLRIRSATLRAFALSAGIHGLGLWLLIVLTPDTLIPETAVTSSPLRLRIVAPQPTPAALADETKKEDLVNPIVETETEAVVPPPNSSRSAKTEVPSVPLPSPSAEPDPIVKQPVELLSPSVLSLRQIVNALPDAETLQRATFDCTALQLENEMLACDNRARSDFDTLNTGNTATYFARPAGPDRTERSIRVLSARSEEIARTLRRGGLSNDFIDNFLVDLKSFAADYSSTGDSKLQQLRDQMYSNDSTYQQSKRAFLQQ